jgi:lipoprotein-releasing system ATP-binding protein
MSDRLELSDVRKSFETESHAVEVLRGISVRIEPRETLSIVGNSGSGKSTLLHVIGTLDPPSRGTVRIGDRDPYALSEPELARFRNGAVGFVFQDHHLLPQYSVLENVLIPTWAFPSAKGGNRGTEERARVLLDRVGLADRLTHRPAELSGGERQRAAVARALINRPGLLLCDEPTGSLDETTAETVASLLFELHRDEGSIMIVVTHSLGLAGRCERRLELKEGRCIEL